MRHFRLEYVCVLGLMRFAWIMSDPGKNKDWSNCSVSCGGGIQTQCRNGKIPCEAKHLITRSCNGFPCVTQGYALSSQLGSTTPLIVTFHPTTNTAPTKKSTEKVACPAVRQDAVDWPETTVGQKAEVPCPSGFAGLASRRCLPANGSTVWGKANFAHCASNKLISIENKLKEIEKNFNKTQAKKVLQELNDVTRGNDSKPLTGSDMKRAINILKKVNDMAKNGLDAHGGEQDKKNFLSTASNLLSPVNTGTWLDLQMDGNTNISTDLVTLIDDFGINMASEIDVMSNNTSLEVETNNIVMRVNKIDTTKQLKKAFLNFTLKSSSVCLPTDASWDGPSAVSVIAVYTNLGDVLTLGAPKGAKKNITKAATTLISSTLVPSVKRFNSPVLLTFAHKQSSKGMGVTCVSWEPESYSNSWKDSGCQVVPDMSNEYNTTCACNHMTVFAALMDPTAAPLSEGHKSALEVISQIGCSLSLVGIILTVTITIVYWRKLKSPRAEVLLNICFNIAMTCVLVIAEPLARHSQVSCATMAILLQFFLLAVFSWMLCEGLLLYVVFIGEITKSANEKLKYFYVFGYGFPIVLVSVSIGISRLQGYGDVGKVCWLSADSGLLWAFIAPALFVITVNTIVLIAIIRRMLSLKLMQKKSALVRVRAGIRAAAVILPLLGITWVFGLLTFGTDTLVFKYLFAVCNSLQGFAVFIFHCAFNNKVHEAMRFSSQRRPRQSMVGLSSIKVQPVRPHDSDPPSADFRRMSLFNMYLRRNRSKRGPRPSCSTSGRNESERPPKCLEMIAEQESEKNNDGYEISTAF